MADIRSFIAVTVDEKIIARLAVLQQELWHADAPVSWTRPTEMHLTLKFFGDVPEGQISGIGDALRDAVAGRASFHIGVEGAGAFPNLRRPRVLWAAVHEGRAALIALAAAVDTAVTALGFPPEDRPFNPHLTLGRVKAPNHLERLLSLMQSHAEDRFGEMTVREVILFRSDLSPQGATYTPLRRAVLDG